MVRSMMHNLYDNHVGLLYLSLICVRRLLCSSYGFPCFVTVRATLLRRVDEDKSSSNVSGGSRRRSMGRENCARSSPKLVRIESLATPTRFYSTDSGNKTKARRHRGAKNPVGSRGLSMAKSIEACSVSFTPFFLFLPSSTLLNGPLCPFPFLSCDVPLLIRIVLCFSQRLAPPVSLVCSPPLPPKNQKH